MSLFRKKPIVVEAFQWRGPLTETPFPIDLSGKGICGDDPLICPRCGGFATEHGSIQTLEGRMEVCIGDWIITGVAGERYPCKDAIFRATYDPVGERPKCRGIAVTVLQPADASIDDYFAPLVDQALAEVAALTSDKLPHDGSEWTASNGVRLYVKLVNETA